MYPVFTSHFKHNFWISKSRHYLSQLTRTIIPIIWEACRQRNHVSSQRCWGANHCNVPLPSPVHVPIDVTSQFVTSGSTRRASPKLCTFWPWGLTPAGAKVHQKGRWPAAHPGLTSRQISSPPCVNPRRRYPLQKYCGQTQKQ